MKKSVLFSIFFFVLSNCFSQKNEPIIKTNKIFVRIYNEKKIHTGFLTQTTDSSIFITKNKKSVEVPLSQINTIKLKRSFGHMLLTTSVITVAMVGASTASGAVEGVYETVNALETASLAANYVEGKSRKKVPKSIRTGNASRPVFHVDKTVDKWIIISPLLQGYLIIK